MSLAAGVRLGPYEILAPLGAGGMGEVYRARDTRLDRTVAIKVLAPHIASNPAFRQRFEREARTISSLDHPHICPLYDVGEHQGTDFLVMQYLQGETLADRLAKGPLPLDQALKHAIEIADALDKAHQQGVIHRDLKPGNVMLTKNGARLLDFGLAKPSGVTADGGRIEATRTARTPMTAEGTILGTLHYMAPEQLEGKEVDARSDIWSFGCMLYEMLTGRRAFTGDSHASIIAAILDREPPRVHDSHLHTSPALDHIVSRCLAKDPDERWQSARDLLFELKWAPQARMPAGAETPARSRTRGPILAALLGVAALGAVAVSVLYLRPHAADRPTTQVDVSLPADLIFENWSDSPVVSPDGRFITFIANRDGMRRLWVRTLDNRTVTPMPGTEGAYGPFWSPDSRSIGFFVAGIIKRVPVTGGPVVTVCDCGAGWGWHATGAWNADGIMLFAYPAGGIYRVAEQGGTPVKVTNLAAGDADHFMPSFLPDGRRFLFMATGTKTGVYMASLDNPEPTRVADEASWALYAEPGYLLFSRGKTLFAQAFDADARRLQGTAVPLVEDLFWGPFSVSRNGIVAYRPTSLVALSQVVWIGRDGKRISLAGDAGLYVQIALSPTGRKLAIVRREEGRNHDLWLLDLTTNVLSRLTSDPRHDSDPAWSPDEKRIAFTSERLGVLTVFQKDLTTGKEEPLIPDPPKPGVVVDDWSPDGRFVIFRNLGRAIYTVTPDAERKIRLIVETGYNKDQSHVSPDGKWIAYHGNESTTTEIYVASFPEFTNKRQLSSGGGRQPLWRADGKELFYLDRDGRLMAVPITTKPSFDAGTPAPLFSTGIRPGDVSQYAVTRDGQKFLILEPERGSSEQLTLLLDWTARVPRQ